MLAGDHERWLARLAAENSRWVSGHENLMQHRDFSDSPKLGVASRLLGFLAFGAAVLASIPANAASPPELPTKWQVPPGNWLEHETAGLAKALCSAIFITGPDLETAAEEDGFFVSPRASRAPR
jgi:hypothetical protein